MIGQFSAEFLPQPDPPRQPRLNAASGGLKGFPMGHVCQSRRSQLILAGLTPRGGHQAAVPGHVCPIVRHLVRDLRETPEQQRKVFLAFKRPNTLDQEDCSTQSNTYAQICHIGY